MNSEKSPADIAVTDVSIESDALVDTSIDVQIDAQINNSDSKLLKFDENNAVSSGKDINTKITALDTDLAHLRAELGAINNSVEEGLDRLGDTDTDLTAKVSETYKRLGEIDNAYKSLLQISSRIDVDIQRLNGNVNDVASQSASGIKNLEQSTVAQSHEFAQKNQVVASRVSQLVETSKHTSELLEQKIQAATETMLQIETRVVSEIETLSASTKDKTDAIGVSVDSNKARILKLQSVDEAIIKRATTLEISSAELIVKSQDMQSSVEQLQLSTGNLSTGLNELREKTRALEDITNNHGSLIGGLQKASSDLSDKLAMLASRESKHFNIFTTSFLLLLIATAVIYFVQQDQFETAEIKYVKQSDVVDNKIVSLQQQQTSASVDTGKSLTALENKVDDLNAVMQEEVNKEFALVERKMKNMHDQVRSVEGRFNNESPFSKIGSDNIIHGSQWIAALPKENFTVQLAYVSDVESLYKLAERYNHYLKDSLSYFEVNDNGVMKYVLLSGSYASPQQAMTKINSLPRYIDMQRPVVRNLAVVQSYLAN